MLSAFASYLRSFHSLRLEFFNKFVDNDIDKNTTAKLLSIIYSQSLLVCTAVVRGLDNFAVGMRDDFPSLGSAVGTSSYTICEQARVNVTAGYVLDVRCPSLTRQFRYVIVQSLDESAEGLCLAEVAVYCGSK